MMMTMYSRFLYSSISCLNLFLSQDFFSLLLSFICMHSRKKPQKVVGFVADWCLFGIQHMLHIFHWVAFFSPFFRVWSSEILCYFWRKYNAAAGLIPCIKGAIHMWKMARGKESLWLSLQKLFDRLDNVTCFMNFPSSTYYYYASVM